MTFLIEEAYDDVYRFNAVVLLRSDIPLLPQSSNCLTFKEPPPRIDSKEPIPPGCVSWAGIFKRVWALRIGSKEWIPPAYVAWRAGTITLFLPGS